MANFKERKEMHTNSLLATFYKEQFLRMTLLVKMDGFTLVE